MKAAHLTLGWLEIYTSGSAVRCYSMSSPRSNLMSTNLTFWRLLICTWKTKHVYKPQRKHKLQIKLQIDFIIAFNIVSDSKSSHRVVTTNCLWCCGSKRIRVSLLAFAASATPWMGLGSCGHCSSFRTYKDQFVPRRVSVADGDRSCASVLLRTSNHSWPSAGYFQCPFDWMSADKTYWIL